MQRRAWKSVTGAQEVFVGGTARERVQGPAFVCLGWVAEATELHFLTAVEGGSSRSRCRQGRLLLRLLPRLLESRLLCLLTSSSLCVCLCPRLLFVEGPESYWIRTHPHGFVLP